ncbi:MAG TPA: class I SAM-dependent methyltransferase [Gemmatimonadaceae bacterium]
MPNRRPRSLKHEYELYVEGEIENYKESIPRSALLAIGDEAVAVLERESQLSLTEILLCEEVDRIIFRRLRLPSYQTWRRRRLKVVAELRRPERWGLAPDAPVVRAVVPSADGRVLVAGAGTEGSALLLAAHGCDVLTIGSEEDALMRVLNEAEAVGLSERVRGLVGDLRSFTPDAPLRAVVCSLSALTALSKSERARALELLKEATADGGIHLVQGAATGRSKSVLDEVVASYAGWRVSMEGEPGTGTLVAWKEVA